jgi:hypothetical protein
LEDPTGKADEMSRELNVIGARHRWKGRSQCAGFSLRVEAATKSLGKELKRNDGSSVLIYHNLSDSVKKKLRFAWRFLAS